MNYRIKSLTVFAKIFHHRYLTWSQIWSWFEVKKCYTNTVKIFTANLKYSSKYVWKKLCVVLCKILYELIPKLALFFFLVRVCTTGKFSSPMFFSVSLNFGAFYITCHCSILCFSYTFGTFFVLSFVVVVVVFIIKFVFLLSLFFLTKYQIPSAAY